MRRVVPSALVVAAFLALPVASQGQPVPVIREDFQDDPGGHWRDTTGNFPTNVGKPGQWLPSGHVANLNPFFPGNTDSDWKPLVQNEVGAAGPVPTGDYMATLNRTSAQSGSVGVFNMDGLIRFTTADGTPRPAVTGEKISGSFDYFAQEGNFGFGFTRSMSALQAYQAALPPWVGTNSSPVMMPTAYSDLEQTAGGGSIEVGISPDITGHIALNGGFNNVFAHAVVDVAENGGAGNGFVDQGNSAPKTDPASIAHRPLAGGARQTIKFEYTVGNSNYDLLQVDQDGPLLPGGFVDILQAPTNTPNPNGPMPVGAVFNSIEGMFITGANTKLTEVWYDNINVDITPVPEPTALTLVALATAGLFARRRTRSA